MDGFNVMYKTIFTKGVGILGVVEYRVEFPYILPLFLFVAGLLLPERKQSIKLRS